MKGKLIWVALVISALSFVYAVTYISIRKIEIQADTVHVTYGTLGHRQYALADADPKIETGTIETTGKRNYLVLLFRPIELLEIDTRFELRKKP